jgi:hypothetical protein
MAVWGTARCGADARADRVDAELRERDAAGGEVGGREADRAAALLAADDAAVDAEGAAEHRGGAFDLALGEGFADLARRDRVAAREEDRVAAFGAKAELGEALHGAFAVPADRGVEAKDQRLTAERVAEHALGEVRGAHFADALVEGDADDVVDAVAMEMPHARDRALERDRRAAAEQGVGMFEKAHEQRGAAELVGEAAGVRDQALVAQMDAVEDADRDRAGAGMRARRGEALGEGGVLVAGFCGSHGAQLSTPS